MNKTFKTSMLPFFLSEKYEEETETKLFHSRIEIIKSIGFDGVEIAVRDAEAFISMGFVDALYECGLPVSAIGTGKVFTMDGLSFTDPHSDIRVKALQRFKKHIDLSHSLGNPPVIIGLIRGNLSSGIDKDEAYGWLTYSLRKCAEYASDFGIKLAFEPLNRYESNIVNTVDDAIKLLDMVQYDNIGLLLDTFHMNIEERSIQSAILKSKARILHFHITDSNRLPPGQGHLDFDSIYDSLFSIGYNGYISGEMFAGDNPIKTFADVYQSMISYKHKEL